MQQLISAARVDKIRAALDAAGQQWESEARRFPEVDGTTHGDAETRDLVHLRRSWGMSVNDGDAIAVCPGVLYRNEITGEWWAQGWSSASAEQIYRPRGVRYDEDAGAWVSTR